MDSKKLHHYCFAREVSIITDHKTLVAILKKRCSNTITETTANSTQNTQIQDHIQDLFIADWFSRQNHRENKDAEILCIQLNIYTIQTTINIQDCMTIQSYKRQNHKMNKSSKAGQRTGIKYCGYS